MHNILAGLAYLSHCITVEDLEHFIETKLAEPLHRVANEGWCPALAQASHTTFLECNFEAMKDVLVFRWVNLKEYIRSKTIITTDL